MRDDLASARRDGEAMRFAPHLVSHATRYFGDLADGPVQVRLRWHSDRRLSRLYEFELESGGHSHSVLVKVPRGPLDGASPEDVQASKSRLEYAALSGMHGLFDRLNDQRFGAIRPLDLLPEHGALVMEKIGGSRLSRLVLQGHRLRLPLNPAATDTALRHAGAWLRAWHSLAALAHTRPRRTSRQSYCDFVAERISALAREDGEPTACDTLRERLCVVAGRVLPADLPLGTSHGDYAPRNILVGAHGEVTVLDTLGRWRAPIYSDLGNFLFAIKAGRAQMYSFGWAFAPSAIARWEGAFLHGYFGEERVPLMAVRLFEIRTLLDKWASLVRRHRAAGSRRGIRAQSQWRASRRFLRKYLQQALSELEHERG